MTPSILITDDQPVVREVLSAILARQGFDVRTAGHRTATIDLLEREAVDLVLLDVHLPGTDGWCILEEVRERWPRLPVIMISDGWRRTTALERGADGFIEKPYGTENVLATIHEVLEWPGAHRWDDHSAADAAGGA